MLDHMCDSHVLSSSMVESMGLLVKLRYPEPGGLAWCFACPPSAVYIIHIYCMHMYIHMCVHCVYLYKYTVYMFMCVYAGCISTINGLPSYPPFANTATANLRTQPSVKTINIFDTICNPKRISTLAVALAHRRRVEAQEPDIITHWRVISIYIHYTHVPVIICVERTCLVGIGLAAMVSQPCFGT